MKNFKDWNKVKIFTEEKTRPEYSEGDIWFSNLGENIGSEECGKGNDFLRPVLVVRKFNKDYALVVPLSITNKTGKYYFSFEFKGKSSNALLPQVRDMDSKRFRYRLGKIAPSSFLLIKEKIRSKIF